MLYARLDETERAALMARRHDPRLQPKDRDRVEMLLLSNSGWDVPRIAIHLGCCRQTVRRLLHAYTSRGLAAVYHQRPGPAKDTSRRQQVETALAGLLEEDRTWTAAQLAEALRREGIHLSPRRTRHYLQGMGARWRRTVQSLAHKQDPVRVARAQRQLASLKKSMPPDTSLSPTSTSVASVPASR
jgi:transposase